MKQRKGYRKPTTPQGKISEAMQAIARLETNRRGQYGETYRRCTEAIMRWQAVIDRERQALIGG